MDFICILSLARRNISFNFTRYLGLIFILFTDILLSAWIFAVFDAALIAVPGGVRNFAFGFLLFWLTFICLLSVMSCSFENIYMRRGQIDAYFSYGFNKSDILCAFIIETVIILIFTLGFVFSAYLILRRFAMPQTSEYFIEYLVFFSALCAVFLISGVCLNVFKNA